MCKKDDEWFRSKQGLEQSVDRDSEDCGDSGLSSDELLCDVIDSSIIKAVFPDEEKRDQIVRDIGHDQLLDQIHRELPVDRIKEECMKDPGQLEKSNLSIGYIPITCATPIIMAEPMGFYRRHGLNVTLKKAKGWQQVQDWAMDGDIDAAHMLCPMPLAISLGCDDSPQRFVMPAVEDSNGSAFTLHRRYEDIQHPSQLKGMTLAVPYRYSMHNYLLRYYLSDFGVDPDRDLSIIELAPQDMLEQLSKGHIDGYFAPEPFNQLAVARDIGFIYWLSKDIWDGHPCCAFSVRSEFTERYPQTFKALFKTIVDATLFCSSVNNRKHIARVIAPERYLNQPVEILEQVLCGEFPDGRGQWRNEPRRINFDPFPWQSMAVWIMTQMKRWGQIKSDFNYRDIAEKVYLAEQCDEQIKHLGYKKRGLYYKKHFVMNRSFDAFKAEQYEGSFDHPVDKD
jgi:nitrate/nitrite transport system substrate-binding protein